MLAADNHLALFAHLWPFSLVAFTNSLAYAVIGLTFIIFVIINLRENPTLRLAGSLLGMSGLASIIGFIGLLSGSNHLTGGTAWGGILFLLSLILFSYFYVFNKNSAEDAIGN
jgi:hypothetical protein